MTSSERGTREGYIVGIDPDAMFSVFYEDNRGRLIFVFEVDDTPKKIYLNQRPLEGGRVLDQGELAGDRARLAVQRVKEYFEAKGLSVDLE